MLQTVFGFLEWQPPEESKPFVSPIIYIECIIKRKQSQSGTEFYLTGDGEPSINTSLQLKLKIDNDLVLPEYDGGDVEAYFKKLADCTPRGWRWKVRREAAVGIFPSAKIAMYNDVDPEQTNVAQSPLVAQLLGTTTSGINGYADDYPPDDPAISGKVPYLVLDADTSQFSAMTDVAEGKHLAIEGPPGSGKSQTIVNIIAPALESGKKVLFVAEKLAALNVVKNRLKSVGLGEFILPLQAERSKSESIFAGLVERLEAKGINNQTYKNFKNKRKHLEQARGKLQLYLDALSSDYKRSDMTVYKVLGHAIAKADATNDLPRDLRRNFPLPDMTEDDIELILRKVELFEQRLAHVENASPIWQATPKIITNRDDADDLAERAGDVVKAIEGFEKAIADCSLFPYLRSTPGINQVIAGLKVLTGLASGQYGAADLEPLLKAGAIEAVQQLIGQLKERKIVKEELSRHLKSPDSPDVYDQLTQAIAFAKKDGNQKLAPSEHKRKAQNAQICYKMAKALGNEFDLLPEVWRRPEYDLSSLRSHLFALFEHTQETRLLGQNLPQDAQNDLSSLRKRSADLESRLSRAQVNLPGLDPSWTSPTRIDQLIRAATTLSNTGFFGRMGGAYKAARKFYEGTMNGSRDVARIQRAEELREAAIILEEIRSFTEDRRAIEMFGALFNGLGTDFERLGAALDASDVMRQLSGNSQDIIAVLVSLKKEQFSQLLMEPASPYLEWFFQKNVTEIAQATQDFFKRAPLESKRARDAQSYMDIFLSTGDVTLSDLEKHAADKVRYDALSHRINISDALLNLPGLSASPEMASHLVEERLIAAQTLIQLGDEVNILKYIEKDGYETTLASLEAVEKEAEQVVKLENELAADLELAPLATALAVQDKKGDYLSASISPEDLLECRNLQHSHKELEQAGLGKFARWLQEAGHERPKRSAAELARAVIAKAMADEVRSLHQESLEGYTGEDLARIRKEIAQYDRELLHLSRQVIRNKLLLANPPEGERFGPKSSYTDMALIKNELNKKRNRLRVRSLTHRARGALIELKPCWMMSPLAVARYIPPELSFDLLVVDEASQMTPENAIGALRRAKQAVVVGDTKQLPPTSFFKKIMEDEKTDEDLREDAESILDLANAAFSPIRQLRWHYRSKHSGLIKFSNHWMYGDKLTIFPAANEDDPKLGVSLKQVNGLYQSHTNRIEAEAVVRAVVQHTANEPDLSLGICTMNVAQKDLILEEFERERERNSSVRAYVEKWEREGDGLEEFFVKNLETIQGDERDVMFISTLYGPERSGGPVRQRFGPINSRQGHRRLNVLFSRAKSRIVTFTSMTPTDIRVDENKAKGVRMFRAWLEYSASGILPGNASIKGTTDSPFEDHVINVIESMGYEAVPQVGVAGFRIDIGVRHPDWPYGFVLGVECDGATYHSSRSARDRDRLRQEILEERGWKLHRIWSTDWFSDTAKERTRLKEAINACLQKRLKTHAESGKESEPAQQQSAQGRQPPPISSGIQGSPGSDDNISETALQPVKSYVDTVEDLPAHIVKVGAKVRLQQLHDGGDDLNLTLSESENSPDDGIIGLKTPLGAAIIDAEEGEEVECQAGPYIRKVKIISITV